MAWTHCPDCDEPMEVDRLHNGVMWTWHGVHCGWGQAYMADEDVYPTREALENTRGIREAPAVTALRRQPRLSDLIDQADDLRKRDKGE